LNALSEKSISDVDDIYDDHHEQSEEKDDEDINITSSSITLENSVINSTLIINRKNSKKDNSNKIFETLFKYF